MEYPWPSEPIVAGSPEENARETMRGHLSREHGYRVAGAHDPYYSDPIKLHADNYGDCPGPAQPRG